MERRFFLRRLSGYGYGEIRLPHGYTSKGENDIQYLDNKRSYNSLGLFLPKLGVPEQSVVSRRGAPISSPQAHRYVNYPPIKSKPLIQSLPARDIQANSPKFVVKSSTKISKETRYHLQMEAWMGGYPEVWKDIQTNYPTFGPKDLGIMGYSGLSTHYLPKPVQQNAYSTAGLALQFYRNWNASWNTPSTYFGSTSSVNSTFLMPCTGSIMSDDVSMRRHVKFTGDADGVVITNAAGLHLPTRLK